MASIMSTKIAMVAERSQESTTCSFIQGARGSMSSNM